MGNERMEKERTEDERWMLRALEACGRGVEGGQSPFGACIVRGGEELVSEHNHVWMRSDPTAHAEVCAIRAACASVKAVHLEGATIYSTTEPCPMCFTAIHWARIGRIVFGATVEDAAGFGFNELRISNEMMKRVSGSRVELVGGVLREEAIGLFEKWRAGGGREY